MENRVSSSKLKKKLDEHLDKWEKGQCNENKDNYNQNSTGISKNSFVIDGIVDVDKWLSLEDGKKVLYLLREANGSKSTVCQDENGEKYRLVDRTEDNDKIFWLRDNCIKSSKQLVKNIRKIQNTLAENKDLTYAAVMNVNKRGGNSSVSWKNIIKYAKSYRKEIIEEISIINPDIIVCCGTFWLLVDHVLQAFDKSKGEITYSKIWKDEVNKKVKIVDLYHPSKPGMSEEKYLEHYKKREKYILTSEGTICVENIDNDIEISNVENKNKHIKIIF